MTRHNDPESNEINSLLAAIRSLPKVNAARDFELRLERRIREHEQLLESQVVGTLHSRRRPAFAYSVMAVCLLCGLIYLLALPEFGSLREHHIARVPVAIQQAPPASTSRPTIQAEPQRSVTLRDLMDQRKTREKIVDRSRVQPQVGQISTQQGQRPAAPSNSQQFRIPDTGIAATRPTIDQSTTTTGILELGDTSSALHGKARSIRPRVSEGPGVGVIGTAISSSLSDSAKTDSLKKIKKQLLSPKGINKKPPE